MDIKIAYVTMQYTQDAPPLGFAYIATYLNRYGEFNDQKIIDVKDEKRIEETLNYSPDIIFISANTMHYKKAIEFAKEIKSKSKIPIVIGGVHITTLPSAFDPIFDLGVIGEGEETSWDLLNIFKEEKKMDYEKLKSVNGLIFFESSKLIQTQPRALIEDLDSIPVPNRDLFDKRYFNKKTIIHTKTAKIITGMMTSRGCPYKCIFCSTSKLWNKVRMNSAEYIAGEMEYLIKKYNVNAFFIYDDLFTINKKRLKELVSILKTRNLLSKFSINCMGRTNTIDEEILSLLKELNTDYINFGFESGSQRILTKLKGKGIAVEDHKRAILLCRKYKIGVQGSLMFGSPEETEEDLQKTLNLIDFMYKNGVDLIWSTITKPLPGTDLWFDCIKDGKITEDIDPERLSVMNVDPIAKDDKLSLETFNRMFKQGRDKIRKMEMRFWFRKFLKDPFHVIMFVLADFKFIKFFTLRRGET